MTIDLQRIDDIGHLAMNLQPRQCLSKGMPMEDGVAGPRRSAHIAEMALQRENLPQLFDVSARQRQAPNRAPSSFVRVLTLQQS